jgi:hypothetical protein
MAPGQVLLFSNVLKEMYLTRSPCEKYGYPNRENYQDKYEIVSSEKRPLKEVLEEKSKKPVSIDVASVADQCRGGTDNRSPGKEIESDKKQESPGATQSTRQ